MFNSRLGCSSISFRHQDLPAALRTRVIRRWLLRHGVPEPTAAHVGMVAALVTAWRGQEWVDLPRVRVLRSAGHLTIQPTRG